MAIPDQEGWYWLDMGDDPVVVRVFMDTFLHEGELRAVNPEMR